MPIIHTVVIPQEEAGLRLDKWFHHKSPQLPFSQVQKLCRSGQLRVNGKRAKGNQHLCEGDKIRWPEFDQTSKSEKATPAGAHKGTASNTRDRLVKELLESILLEDQHYIVFNKPAGLATQGGTGVSVHVDGLLGPIAKAKKLQAKLHLTHRLDRETSGILVVAKSSLAAKKAADAFRAHDVQKTYLALCEGLPSEPSGTIQSKLKEDLRGGERFMVSSTQEGKKAVTHFTCLDHAHTEASLLALEPQTGRTHQLRVHCSNLGCPIFGDGRYNPNQSANHGPMMLHAWGFAWPARRWKIQAPLPPSFKMALKVYGLALPPEH